MLQIKCFYFNPFRECCTVASDESGEAVIVDPGCYDDQELDTVTSYVGRNGYKVVKILLTHGHFDHLFGVTSLAGLYDVPVLMSAEDISIADNSGYFSKVFGVKLPDTSFTAPAEKGGRLTVIKDGDIIEWGAGRKWEVIATPGHTPGSTTFFDRKARYGFSGDAFGSTNLLLSTNFSTLICTTSRIAEYMEKYGITKLYPGHYHGDNPETLQRVRDLNRMAREVLSGEREGKYEEGMLGLNAAVTDFGVTIRYNYPGGVK